MREHPILFKGEMVRAIIEGRKTMTRRINFRGLVGDRMWVKETFRYYNRIEECICYEDCSCPATGTVIYRASNDTNCGEKWKPSLFMRRLESRILLEITAIREEYLQDITEDDAIKEGVQFFYTDDGEDTYYAIERDKTPCAETPSEVFAMLWDTCAPVGKKWTDNPIVKRIEFRRVI